MSRPMRSICFVTAVSPTLNAFVRPIAEEAKRRGYRTIAVSGGEGGTSAGPDDAFDTAYGIPEFRRQGPVAMVRALRHLIQIMRDDHVDLLHLHTPFAVALGRLAATLTGTPSIAVVHGTLLEGARVGGKTFRLVEGACAWLGRNYITLNDEDAAWYRRAAPRASVKVAPAGGAGVDTDALSPRHDETAVRPETPVALVLGRLTDEKNPAMTVEAWLRARRQLPALRLRFVGSALPGEVAWAPPRIDGLEHRGWTDHPAQELARAAALVTCSPREGFPMGVAEALVAGVPVVAVSNRGTRMIARQVNPPLLRVVPADADEVAAALVAAVRAPDPARLPADVRTRWDRRNVIDFHLTEIERIGGPPGPGPRTQR